MKLTAMPSFENTVRLSQQLQTFNAVQDNAALFQSFFFYHNRLLKRVIFKMNFKHTIGTASLMVQFDIEEIGGCRRLKT
jgi:hypothetical protein